MKKKPNAQTKKLLIALVFALLVLLAVLYPRISAAFQTQVDYGTFVEQVESHRIDEISIDEQSDKITYKLQDGKTYYTNYPDYEDFKKEILESGVKIKIDEKNAIAEMLPYLSLVIYALIVFVLLRSLNPGGRSNIENSAKIKINFSDVAGLDEIKEDLLLLADMMKNPDYAKSGARLPKGILLEGPPGNGKTFISKAFAGETGVNFIAVNASDFSSSLVGAGSSKVRKLFKKARANKPCIIFIDEIDGVGSKRSSDSSAAGREMNTIITALLNEMDGFDSSDGIMVMAATNRADELDEALIRPGRFDRHLVISYPDKEARIALLKLYTKGAALSPDLDIDKLATRTYGCSCSEIECIANEAVIVSIKEKHSAVTQSDFEEAIIRMTVKGSVKKHSNQDEKSRTLTAYHEAGHAVAGHFLTDEIISTVSIKPTTSGAGGFTVTESESETSFISAREIKGKIMMAFGGRAAEYLLGDKDSESVSTGAADDIRKATRLAVSYVETKSGIDYSLFADNGKNEVMKKAEEILDDAWSTAVDTLSKNWSYVEQTAALLLDKETLSRDEFIHIFS